MFFAFGLVVGAAACSEGAGEPSMGAVKQDAPLTAPKGVAEIRTVAGTNGVIGYAESTGPGTSAMFDTPAGIVSDGRGMLYVADSNHVIRQIEIATGKTTPFAGEPRTGHFADGVGGEARFDVPFALAIDSAKENIYVNDMLNCVIRRLNLATREVTTLVGRPRFAGSDDGVGSGAFLSNNVVGLTVDDTDAARPMIYFVDGARIRSVDVSSRTVKTIAGEANTSTHADGIGTAARFAKPFGIAVVTSPDGLTKRLLVTEAANRDVREIDLATGAVRTIAGSPEGGPDLGEYHPPANLQNGFVTYHDGVGTNARFRFPQGALIDDTGRLLFMDAHNNVVRAMDVSTHAVSTVAGVQFPISGDETVASQDSTATAPGTFRHAGHLTQVAPKVFAVSDSRAETIRIVRLP